MRVVFLFLFISVQNAAELFAREAIHIVGSNTLYPFLARLAESFSETTNQTTPILEAMGTGGGAKLFCAGFGSRDPDILNASRPLTEAEKNKCKSNNVEWHELKVGYDGIVFAEAPRATRLSLTKDILYKGLAHMLSKGGMYTTNLYKNWHEIDPSLEDRPILFFGPQSGSGTKDALIELILLSHCKESNTFDNLTQRQKKTYCYNIRNDLHYVEIGENYQFVFHKTLQNKDAIGIFSYGFFLGYKNKLNPIAINGVFPLPEHFENGSYPLLRPLYLYVKKNTSAQHNLSQFLKFLSQTPDMKQGGALTKIGFIPLIKTEYTLEQQIQKIVR